MFKVSKEYKRSQHLQIQGELTSSHFTLSFLIQITTKTLKKIYIILDYCLLIQNIFNYYITLYISNIEHFKSMSNS